MKTGSRMVGSEFIWIGGLLLIDIVTKSVFQDANGTVIQSVFNTTASWGIPFPMGMLIIISIVAILLGFIAYAQKLLTYWSFVFLMAGALGNLFDRLIYGGVRDRINIGIIPVFNIADILITLGVCVFVYHEWSKQLGKR